MHSTFHRHTALFVLSLQILMNCIVLPFHRHEMMPNAGPWAITAAAEEGTEHSSAVSHIGDCSVCHSIREVADGVSSVFLSDEVVLVSGTPQTESTSPFSTIHSAISPRGPPVRIS